jgi:hypothetical protein
MLLVKRQSHLAAGDEALEASANVTLASGNFEVTVDDTKQGCQLKAQNWIETEKLT